MSAARLRVAAAGPGVTLQDGGRRGYLRYGVTGAGPMDRLAFATAHRAIGNEPDGAAIEVSVGGIELACEEGTVDVAIAGGAFDLLLDDVALPSAAVATLTAGSRLRIRAGAAGGWAYVAVAGRIDLPPVLGSLSTHSRSAMGGIEGRALIAGDGLPIADARATDRPPSRIVVPWLDRPAEAIRVVMGPQDDYFAVDEQRRFLDGPWTVAPRGDRMACFLEGQRLSHAKGFNIVSDGIAPGAIQVPGEGLPIVLLADRQPTGGYPKIATVIGPDIGRLAQARAGQVFRFVAVPIAEAVAARRAEAEALARPIRIEPLVRTDLPAELLLGLNLISGAVDARPQAREMPRKD